MTATRHSGSDWWTTGSATTPGTAPHRTTQDVAYGSVSTFARDTDTNLPCRDSGTVSVGFSGRLPTNKIYDSALPSARRTSATERYLNSPAATTSVPHVAAPHLLYLLPICCLLPTFTYVHYTFFFLTGHDYLLPADLTGCSARLAGHFFRQDIVTVYLLAIMRGPAM